MRRLTKRCGIYQITAPNGDFYIGSSHDVILRKSQHFSAMRRGNCRNKKLQAAWSGYGEEMSFSIIHNCRPHERIQIEQIFIDLRKPTLNNSKSARCPMFDEDVRRRVSETRKRLHAENPEKAKLIASVMSRAVFCRESGVRYSSISEAKVKTGFSAHSISESCQTGVSAHGLHFFYENIAPPTKSRNTADGVLITCIETNAEFTSYKDAAIAMRIRIGGVRRSCETGNSAGGYHFKNSNDVNYKVSKPSLGRRVLCITTGVEYTHVRAAENSLGLHQGSVN